MRKLCAALCAAILVVSHALPVAADQRPKRALTVDRAAEHVVAFGSEMRRNDHQLTLNERQARDLRNNLTMADDLFGFDLQWMQNDMQATMLTNNAQLIRERTAFNMAQLFASIIAAENDLKLHVQSMDIAAKEYEIAKVRARLGHISAVELDAAAHAVEKAANDKISKEIAIANAYLTLNRLMGEPADNRYDLLLDMPFAPLAESNVQGTVAAAAGKSAHIARLQSDVDVAAFQQNRNTDTDQETALQIALYQAQLSLTDAEKELRDRVRSTYNDIMEMETSRTSALLDLEDAQRQLDVQEVQYALGKITALALEKSRHQLARQEEALRRLDVSHGLKVQQFKNVDLLS